MMATALICIACFAAGALTAHLAGRPRAADHPAPARLEAERQWAALMAYDGSIQEEGEENHENANHA